MPRWPRSLRRRRHSPPPAKSDWTCAASFHTPGSGNQPALEHGIAVNRPAAPAALPDEGMDLRNHMANIELGLINEALERTQGVVAHAAQLLGLRRTTLVEKLRKYGIEREQAELAG